MPGITMNVSVTAELGRFVQRQVRSGLYQSASEVVREALRLLVDRRRAELREETDRGDAQARRRLGSDAAASMAAIRARRKEKKR